MKELTPRQQVIFDFVKGFIRKHGWAPTHREIQKHFGFSITHARNILLVLEGKGVLKVERGVPRGVQVKEPLKIYQSSVDSENGCIQTGDYVHVENGRVTGITREIE